MRLLKIRKDFMITKKFIIILLAGFLCQQNAFAEKVGKRDTFWFEFNAESFYYEANGGKVTLGAEIPKLYGRNFAQGPALLSRNGNLARAEKQSKPKVNIIKDASFYYISYTLNKGYCPTKSYPVPNCTITFKFTFPISGAHETPATYDPTLTMLTFSGRTQETSPPVLVANTKCLKNKKCNKIKDYQLESGSWSANLRFVNN